MLSAGMREPGAEGQKEPELLQGLLDLFFLPGEQEQREWFLERIKMDGPPPLKWEW